MGRGKQWTKAHETALLQGAGVYGFAWFEAHTGDSFDWPNAPSGRSRGAVKTQANRMFEGGLTRGAYTLREACRITGYDRKQIRRGMAALAQKWKRLSPNGAFLIYEEQLEEIVQWLRTDYWSAKHRLYNCLWCNTEQRPHRAAGLCQRCYFSYYGKLSRAGLPLGTEALLGVLRSWQNPKILTKAEKNLSRGRAVTLEALRLILACV